jgi:hypothetical protein
VLEHKKEVLNQHLKDFVDLKKAFDSLEWTFILTTLKHFGFNESFIIWVKTLYSNIQTCVMNNGWISTDISFLELKYSVVSSVNCEFFMLCVCSSILI